MWLVAVVGRCLAGSEHYEGLCSVEHVSGVIMPIFRRTKTLLLHFCVVLVLLDVVGSGCGALSCRK